MALSLANENEVVTSFWTIVIPIVAWLIYFGKALPTGGVYSILQAVVLLVLFAVYLFTTIVP